MIQKLDDTCALHNGVKMPGFGFGTWQSAAGDITVSAVKAAVKAGYRNIDTAAAYHNEEAVGAGIKNCGVPRGELFITTKVWFRSYETEDCRASLEESMRKLGVDYLDARVIIGLS